MIILPRTYATVPIFRHHIILVLTDKQTYSGVVYVCLELVVDGRNIEAQLSQERWMEGLGFQFYDHIRMEVGIVKQQIRKELLLTYFQTKLSAHIGESLSKFQQETSDIVYQFILNVSLIKLLSQTEKVRKSN